MSLLVDIEKRLGNFMLRSKFEASSGTMALLGASGCGKSVTLRCIAGIMTPDSGRIVLDGTVKSTLISRRSSGASRWRVFWPRNRA